MATVKCDHRGCQQAPRHEITQHQFGRKKLCRRLYYCSTHAPLWAAALGNGTTPFYTVRLLAE